MGWLVAGGGQSDAGGSRPTEGADGAYHGQGLPCPQLSATAFADTPERYQTYLAAATLDTDHPPPPGPQLPPPERPAPLVLQPDFVIRWGVGPGCGAATA